MSRARFAPSADDAIAAALGRQLNLAAKATRQYLDRRLVAAGGGYVIWTVLSALFHGGTVIQRELAANLAVEGPTLTHRLARMEQAGLVARTPSSTDRRAAQVALTDQGRQMYERLAKVVFDGSAHILNGLAAEDAAKLHGQLVRIVENCEAAQL